MIANLVFKYGPLTTTQIYELACCENITGSYENTSRLKQSVDNSIKSLFHNTHILRMNPFTYEWEFNANGVYVEGIIEPKRKFVTQKFFIKPSELQYEQLGNGMDYVYAIYSPNNRLYAAINKQGYFPIKIGKTKNLIRRIDRLSESGPGMLAIGLAIKTNKATNLESNIHTQLTLRGRSIEIPGRKEWFLTNLDEVRSIYKKSNWLERK